MGPYLPQTQTVAAVVPCPQQHDLTVCTAESNLFASPQGHDNLSV